MKEFLQRNLQGIMEKDITYLEHQTLGQQVISPSKPVFYIVVCRTFIQLAATNGQLSQSFNFFSFWKSTVYQSILAFQSYDKIFETERKTIYLWNHLCSLSQLYRGSIKMCFTKNMDIDTEKYFNILLGY